MRSTLSLDDFRQRTALQENLPIRFRNGAKMTEFTGHCLDCRKPIPAAELRGQISSIGLQTYRDVETDVCMISVDGYCRGCNLVTPFRYGVAGVGKDFELFTIRDGDMVVWTSRRDPWWRRAAKWLGRLAKQKKEQT